MSRLRHRKAKPYSGPARHLNPPYGPKRRHGGRLHMKAEGKEAHQRKDRVKRRQLGGAATMAPTPSVMGPPGIGAATQPGITQAYGAPSAGMGAASVMPTPTATSAGLAPTPSMGMASGAATQSMMPPPANLGLATQRPMALKRGGHVHKHRARGGRAHKADGGPTGSQDSNQSQMNSQMAQQATNALQQMNQPLPPGRVGQATARQYATQDSNGKKDGGGHWMQKAFANAHGQFKAKAAKAGVSTQAFAHKVEDSDKASTKTKRQANLALIAKKTAGKRH